jgi:NADP-dependent 3-hydroxy acid dehydrogenase YdfG
MVVVAMRRTMLGAMDRLERFAAQGRRLPACLVDVVDYDSCQNAVSKIHAEIGPIAGWPQRHRCILGNRSL